MSEEWNADDEATYQPLRRKLLRIQAKTRRDKTRKRKYSPRLPSNSVKESG